MVNIWKHAGHYRWLIVLNLFLLSPLLFSIGVGSGYKGLKDTVVYWNIVCSIIALFAFQQLFKRPVVFHLLIAPLYLTVTIDLFLGLFYGTRLTAGYIWIMLVNHRDAADYFQDFRTPVLLASTAFLAFYLTGLWKIRHLTIERSPKMIAASLSLLVLLYTGAAAKQTIKHHLPSYADGFSEILELDLGSPGAAISQGIVVLSAIEKNQLDRKKRENFSFHATRDQPSGPEVHVVVIGESARPDRWGINGYERETTPILAGVTNLVSYKNVISGWPLTQITVPIMLTRATPKDFSKALEERSIITALHEGGFETHWITTQPFDHYSGFIHIIAGDADHIQYMNRVYDEVMLGPLDEILANARSNDSKHFIFMHTQGSHEAYINRYPPEFSHYPDSGAALSRKERLNNAYDNSIMHTDWFLSEIISHLDALDIVASLIYVSDHGENLMDDDRALVGHNFGNEYDLPIAMAFWFSDEYRRLYPEKVRNAKRNTTSRLATSNVFHSIADMVDLHFPAFREDMSIFSAALSERPRIVYRQNENRLFDYDEIYEAGLTQQ